VKSENIEGLARLRAQLEAMTQSLFSEEVAQVYLAAARKLRDAARRQAPVSTWPVISRWTWNKKTGEAESQKRMAQGALRRAIIAYKLRSIGSKIAGGPAAKAQVNILRGRERAPHGHLVEFGTRTRVAKSGRRMPFPAKGGRRWLFAREVKGAPANPFFSRAVQMAGQSALDAAALAVQKIIEKSAVKQ
jgi:HK97 gp10 family phage protein